MRFGDVSLFVSWPPNSVTEPPSRLTRHSEPSSAAADRELRYQLQAEDLLLTRWRGKRVVVVPDGSTDTFALKDLHTILPRLIAVGQQIAPSGAPLYFALHLGRLTAPRHARRHAQQSDDSGRLAGRPVLSTEQFRALLNEVDAVRASTGLVVGERDPKVLDGALLAREPAYFEHYSPARRRRGYLMFDPRFSLLIDAPESDVRLLLSMVQQATLEPGGITAVSYGAVLARVSL